MAWALLPSGPPHAVAQSDPPPNRITVDVSWPDDHLVYVSYEIATGAEPVTGSGDGPYGHGCASLPEGHDTTPNRLEISTDTHPPGTYRVAAWYTNRCLDYSEAGNEEPDPLDTYSTYPDGSAIEVTAIIRFWEGDRLVRSQSATGTTSVSEGPVVDFWVVLATVILEDPAGGTPTTTAEEPPEGSVTTAAESTGEIPGGGPEVATTPAPVTTGAATDPGTASGADPVTTATAEPVGTEDDKPTEVDWAGLVILMAILAGVIGAVLVAWAIIRARGDTRQFFRAERSSRRNVGKGVGDPLTAQDAEFSTIWEATHYEPPPERSPVITPEQDLSHLARYTPDGSVPPAPPEGVDLSSGFAQRSLQAGPGKHLLLEETGSSTQIGELPPGTYLTGTPQGGRVPVYDHSRGVWGWIVESTIST